MANANFGPLQYSPLHSPLSLLFLNANEEDVCAINLKSENGVLTARTGNGLRWRSRANLLPARTAAKRCGWKKKIGNVLSNRRTRPLSRIRSFPTSRHRPHSAEPHGTDRRLPCTGVRQTSDDLVQGSSFY